MKNFLLDTQKRWSGFSFHVSFTGLVTFWLVTFANLSAHAHEYYLQPDKYFVAVGEQFGVDHRNGVKFKGSRYPWITRWNVRSEAWQNGVPAKVFGKDGDRPALSLKSGQPGLISVIHESARSTLTFKKWEKFKSYLADEGLTEKLADHKAAGYPETGIKEVYTRFAKTLINVGGAKGEDIPTGLTIELVALKNPANLKAGDPFPVQVLYKGEPLSGVTVKVFAGMDTEAAHRIVTDGNGKVLVPDSGTGPYLLNAVHMIKPVSNAKSAEGAHWETFWASMTMERR